MKIYRRKDVEAKLCISRSSIYDRLDPKSKRYDPTFPRPLKMGHMVGWLESEIDAWIKSRISARDSTNLSTEIGELTLCFNTSKISR